MRNVNRFIAAIAAGLFFVAVANADTLELKSGKVLQGKYLGGTQHVLRFEINGEVQTFSTSDIVALTFTGRSSSPAPAAAAVPSPPPAPAVAQAPAPRGKNTFKTGLFARCQGVEKVVSCAVKKPEKSFHKPCG